MVTKKKLAPFGAAVAMAMVVLLMPPAGAQEEEAASSGSHFVSFPSFRPRFQNGSERFSLIANFYIVNASPQTLQDVTYRQTFPAEMRPKLAPEDLQAQVTHPPEFWQKIEDNSYLMFEPKIYRRQPATILAELTLDRRMAGFTIPPTEIDYTSSDGPGHDQTLPITIDVTEYANHVGDLERFLRKHAGIGLDVKVSGQDEWEFAPISAVAKGKNPHGIVGIETADNGYSGHFRLHHGAPGEALDILVVWKQIRKDESLQEEAEVRRALSEYLKWTGPFRLDPDATQVTQNKFKKYKAWILEGRWIDTVPKRLNSGPLKAVVFYSGREDVEYYLLVQAQGRGAGAEKSEIPAPEKEKELMQTLEKVLVTFRSDISPISYNR